MPTLIFAAAVLLAALLAPGAAAFSFDFTSPPRQFQDLSFNISGSGNPPYIGAKPSGFTNDARQIYDLPFNDSSSLSFQLRYPEDSQFIVVVSDSSGFGTGGASTAVTVLSGDSGCYNSTTDEPFQWYFVLEPPNQLVQRVPERIWWDPAKAQGDPTFSGVIPGGKSFDIPSGALTIITGYGTGFDWTPSIQRGIQVIILGNDERGIGSGGRVPLIVSQGSELNDTCLNDASPNTTPAPAAGGSYYPTSSSNSSGPYPTSISDSGTGFPRASSADPSASSSGAGFGGGGSGSGGSTNIGAIIGGALGGAAALIALLVFLCMWKRRRLNARKEYPVDLLQDGKRDSLAGAAYHDEHLQHYRPEPFLLPGAIARGTAGDGSSEPSSVRASSGAGRAGTPDRSSISAGKRESAAEQTPLRPRTIVQHEDAHHVEVAPQEDEPETIELPPAYTHIRRGPSARVPPAAAAVAGEEGSSLLVAPRKAPAAV